MPISASTHHWGAASPDHTLVVAFNFGAHERAVNAARRWREWRKTHLTALPHAVGVIVAMALLIDAAYFFATGEYLTS